MGNQSSRPSPEQDVSKKKPIGPSSTSSVSGNAGAAAASQPKAFSRLSKSGAESGVINKIAYAPDTDKESRRALADTSSWHTSVIYDPLNTGARIKKITQKFLHAVAYGMESRDVNVDPKPSELFAKDLLEKSPEFLLERAHLTDWAGRTFKGRMTKEHPEGEGITAFEYALWAKDFKMIEMMLKCITNAEERHRINPSHGISEAEGNGIRAGLLEQCEQVTAPIHAGGGLTYELTYDRPVQDANGIPLEDAAGVWQTTSVTETHTENHFDLNPLIRAYEDYDTNYAARTRPQRVACWIKVVGMQQCLLPINILQRYCDPDMPFYPVPSFTGTFRRATSFYNYILKRSDSLISSFVFSDLALFRAFAPRAVSAVAIEYPKEKWKEWSDLVAVRRIDKVSTNEIEKIKRLLASPEENPTQFFRP